MPICCLGLWKDGGELHGLGGTRPRACLLSTQWLTVAPQAVALCCVRVSLYVSLHVCRCVALSCLPCRQEAPLKPHASGHPRKVTSRLAQPNLGFLVLLQESSSLQSPSSPQRAKRSSVRGPRVL